MSFGSLVDYESQKIKGNVLSRKRGRIVFFREMLWFMPVSPWTVDRHVRWGCRNSHQDWWEELGDNSKNNSLTWQKGNNSYEFHVAKGSLFRKYSWSCSHSNSQFVGRLLDEVIGESRQSDHSSENWEIFGSGCSSKLQGTHGAQGLLIKRVQNIHAHKGETCFFLNALRIYLSPAPLEGPFHAMFLRTSMDSVSQDATKIMSALADLRIYSSVKVMALDMPMNDIIIFSVPHLPFLPMLWQCRHQHSLVSAWQAIRSWNQFMKIAIARFLGTS